jgi:Oxidoreductase molybdopterin binding domain
MSENNLPPPAPPPAPAEDHSAERELRRRTRRSFLVGLSAIAAGYTGWRWLSTRPEIDGEPGPLRKMLGFNERLSERIFDPARQMKELPESALTPKGPRTNGDLGLDAPVDLNGWRLHVADTTLRFTLADLKTLPERTQITPLNCIEGWTTVARWTGVRLADFADKYFPEGRNKKYVGLTTPDQEYYVGLDAPSAFHDQTLLCYAINGQPLSHDHGAPLRLVIPTKYGVKNLKRVGEIHFTNDRPADYWAEQGYDWFAGF